MLDVSSGIADQRQSSTGLASMNRSIESTLIRSVLRPAAGLDLAAGLAAGSPFESTQVFLVAPDVVGERDESAGDRGSHGELQESVATPCRSPFTPQGRDLGASGHRSHTCPVARG